MKTDSFWFIIITLEISDLKKKKKFLMDKKPTIK